MLMSEKTDQLFTAMAKAQGEIEDPIKGKVNPHFKSKYVPLEAAREAAQEVLASHGLYIGQHPSCDAQGRISLTTIITHSSGQWMESSFPLPLPPNATAQQFGSAMTYARRYSFMAALGLAGEPDDDGNKASEPARNVERKAAPAVPQIPAPPVVDDEDASIRAWKAELEERANEECERGLGPYKAFWSGLNPSEQKALADGHDERKARAKVADDAFMATNPLAAG